MLIYPTLDPLGIELKYTKMLELVKNHSVGMPMSGDRAYKLIKRVLDKMPTVNKAHTR